MARIRFSGGIVPAGDVRVWLVDAPGHEVDGSRPLAGAPVVVGPACAAQSEVDGARRRARSLVTAGGPLVAAAGVDLGHGFRTARLEGGGEARRDAVLAAVELLGIEGIARIGARQAVLVALFGARATKRVGALALARLAGESLSALRLAVAASDLLEPEQLEAVLAFEAPDAVEAVPPGTTALLADQLGLLLRPFSSTRRLALVRSLWDEVVAWHLGDRARGRVRRAQVSGDRAAALLTTVRRQHDAWWREQAFYEIGDRPSVGLMMAWVPPESTWRAALWRAFQDCASATVLLRVALAAEDRPVEDAVLAHLEPLAAAATLHTGTEVDPITALHGAGAAGLVAADRARALANAVVLASEPGDPLDQDVRAHLYAQLRQVCELAQAVLRSTLDLVNGRGRTFGHSAPEPGLRAWRAVVGYTPARDPRHWRGGDDPAATLATRLEHAGDPAEVERLDDLLWLAELADALAAWFGHPQADVTVDWLACVDADPAGPPADPRRPSLESVPLAVAGAAQLVALGAMAPARPASWPDLVDGVVAGSERLGLDGKLTVPGDLVAQDGCELAGTDVRVELGRTAQQLAEWGNYMGNCIASYAEYAGGRYALVAFRDGAGKLVANVAVQRTGERWWIDEAHGRFNGPLAADLQARLAAWAYGVRAPAPAPTTSRRRPTPDAPARPSHRRRGRGRPAARDRLLRAAGHLADVIGEPRRDAAVVAVREVWLPIARELGWTGNDADWAGPFVAVARPRRPGTLAAATARSLARGHSLARVWEATCVRPLASAAGPDLSRLADPNVPPSLRLALRERPVWQARVVDLAGHRVRLALAELLAAADPRLDRAAVTHPHTGFVAAAVLAVTAGGPSGARDLAEVPVSSDGTLPGRPGSSVVDPAGPWADARRVNEELGVPAHRIAEVLDAAPGHHLLVPADWTTPDGWAALWSLARRETRHAGAASVAVVSG